MLLTNNNLTPTFATSNMEDVKHPALLKGFVMAWRLIRSTVR